MSTTPSQLSTTGPDLSHRKSTAGQRQPACPAHRLARSWPLRSLPPDENGPRRGRTAALTSVAGTKRRPAPPPVKPVRIRAPDPGGAGPCSLLPSGGQGRCSGIFRSPREIEPGQEFQLAPGPAAHIPDSRTARRKHNGKCKKRGRTVRRWNRMISSWPGKPDDCAAPDLRPRPGAGGRERGRAGSARVSGVPYPAMCGRRSSIRLALGGSRH
jgi:hypothetical protein